MTPPTTAPAAAPQPAILEPPPAAARFVSFALVRALVHRGVHFAAERKAIEFCALATFLGEMIGHAHGLMHDRDKSAPAHRDAVH